MRVLPSVLLLDLDAAPADAWMVGDNLEWDVAGAQAAGLYGVWLDKRGTGLPSGADVRPELTVRAVSELLPAQDRVGGLAVRQVGAAGPAPALRPPAAR